MECAYCHSRMERGTAPFNVDRAGYHVHWNRVPAWVCTQCGEAHFEAREVELIQRALAALDEQSTHLAAAS